MPWQGVRLTSLPPCSQRVNRLCDVLLYSRCSFRLRTGFSCIYCRLRSMWSLTLCWFWFQFMKNICEVWTFFLKTIAPHDIPHFNLAKFDVNRLARIYRTYIRVLNASYYSAFMIGAEICALYSICKNVSRWSMHYISRNFVFTQPRRCAPPHREIAEFFLNLFSL